MGIGDWGLGIGDWGLGIGPNPQSPIPNPQSPIPILILYIILNIISLIKILITYIYYILYMPKNTTFLIKNIYLIVILFNDINIFTGSIHQIKFIIRKTRKFSKQSPS